MREVVLTLFLWLVWVRFADFGMQLDLSPNLVRCPMKRLALEIQKQIRRLQAEPGWRQGCLPPPKETLQEWVIRGSRSGARGSAQHLLGGARDLESPKALFLFFRVG